MATTGRLRILGVGGGVGRCTERLEGPIPGPTAPMQAFQAASICSCWALRRTLNNPHTLLPYTPEGAQLFKEMRHGHGFDIATLWGDRELMGGGCGRVKELIPELGSEP